jgi:transposase
VAADAIGVSGRAMIEALIAGERDPAVLADLAKGVLRKKIPDLTLALAGRFAAHHGLLCALHLRHIDHLNDMIGTLDTQIDEQISPYAAQRDRLTIIPGIGPCAAQTIIAEIGVDMSRFPSPDHLASWAGLCPGNHESAGKRRSGATRHGNPCPASRTWLKILGVKVGDFGSWVGVSAMGHDKPRSAGGSRGPRAVGCG